MTPEQEEAEIIRNARAAKERGEITEEQLHDVYYVVARARAERDTQRTGRGDAGG